MADLRQRPLIFKWRHFEPHIILCAVRWYLRFSLSYRDVQELLTERGVEVDHSTIWRWVQRFAPELNQRLRPHLKPTNRSWRVDETYVRVKGRWCYLYRAIDSSRQLCSSARIVGCVPAHAGFVSVVHKRVSHLVRLCQLVLIQSDVSAPTTKKNPLTDISRAAANRLSPRER